MADGVLCKLAENDCSEVLRLTEHHVSVSCASNLSSGLLQDEVKPEDSVSQTSRSTKKSSSTTTSNAHLKAATRKELKRRQLELQHDQELKS